MLNSIYCLGVRQPWASALLDTKDYENRNWYPSHLVATGKGKPYPWFNTGFWMAVCATKGMTNKEYLKAQETMIGDYTFPDKKDLPRGFIIGLVFIDAIYHIDAVDYDDDLDSPWAFGEWCWHIAHRVKLEPFPHTSQLKLYDARKCDLDTMSKQVRAIQHLNLPRNVRLRLFKVLGI
jgi:hypothetical protein